MTEQLTTARPYAKALFSLAKDNDFFTQWHEALQVLAMIAKDDRIIAMLQDPHYAKRRIVKLFTDIVSEVIKEIDTTLRYQLNHLINLLADNKRLAILAEIAEIYQQLMADQAGIVNVDIALAYEIDATGRQAIINALAKRLSVHVNANFRVDPSLIGGVIVRSPSKFWVIDGSMRRRLQKLNDYLT